MAILLLKLGCLRPSFTKSIFQNIAILNSFILMASNKKYIVGISWAVLGGILGMVASLVTIMFAVRMLTKEDMGAYFLVLLIAQMAILAGDFGLRNTVVKILSQLGQNDDGSTINFFFSISIIASFFAVILLTLVTPLIEDFWPYESFLAVSFYTIPIALFTINYLFLNSLLAGISKFRPMSAINAGIEILRMILSIIFIFSGFGIAGMLVGMIISRILGIMIIWYVLPVKPRIVFNGYLKHIDIFRFSGWIYGASILSFVSTRMSDLILVKLLGPSALAILATSRQVPSLVRRLFESIRSVLLAFTSSRKYSGEQLIIQEFRFVAGVLTVLSMCLILLANPIIIILFSSEYKESIDIMRAFSTWVGLSLVNYYIVIYLTGRGFGKKLFALTIPQAILAPALSILLIPEFGIMGVVSSLIVTSIIGNMLGCWFVAEGRVGFFIKLNFAIAKSSLPLVGLFLWVLFSKDTIELFVLQGISGMLVLLFTGAVSVKELISFVKQLTQKNKI